MYNIMKMHNVIAILEIIATHNKIVVHIYVTLIA